MVQIFKLLEKKTTSEMLRFFLENPTVRIHAEKLINTLGMSRRSVIGCLKTLLESEVLTVEEIGRTRQYTLNRTNPLVKKLKAFYNIDKIMPLLKNLQNINVEVYLYGSAARGEDSEDSDIDLLIIGDKPAKNVIGKIGKMENLKPVYFTYIEYSKLARTDKAFYERIEKDKIRLI